MRPHSFYGAYGVLKYSLLLVFFGHATLAAIAPSSGGSVRDVVERPVNSTSLNAQELVEKALKVLAVVNQNRVENPVFNEMKLEDPEQEYKPAPLLDYEAEPSSLASMFRRQSDGSSQQSSKNTTVIGSYRIPPELAEAAAAVAESTPQIPLGDHEEVAAQIRKKYTPSFLNDTNTAEELQAPEGRLSVFAGDGTHEKRASGYWLIDDQNFPGQSPFSPSGYKVWRNVKDFGAKGDGKTDDTVAINKAISDGARCGEQCKTSTISPAVVYFPPGTYLVSGSIIQYYNTQFLGDVSSKQHQIDRGSC